RRYTLKEVKEAYDPVIAELKERANMFRLEKAGLMEAAKILAERGKIDYKEFRSLTSQKAREFAKNEKFDLDKAQDKFLKKKE
ncbi:MAG: hypothetical protein ACOCP6_01655, partial [Desulfosalsimonas sp.]